MARNWSVVGICGYLMLLTRDRLRKLIERRMWWKRWGFSSGMRRALGWGCASFIRAPQNDSVHQINKKRHNRPFLFRKDLGFCVHFVIQVKLMSAADWARSGSCQLVLSG